MNKIEIVYETEGSFCVFNSLEYNKNITLASKNVEMHCEPSVKLILQKIVCILKN